MWALLASCLADCDDWVPLGAGVVRTPVVREQMTEVHVLEAVQFMAEIKHFKCVSVHRC
ncbi:hypothetical protein DPMN_144933 [Dreissena polymorpha]|uniref:Uncharacterized protein n=1 Tax=Dreissena polymorpha TaxID=45954 RepID=A0A9D4F8X2_DREPO|nr:hypothetical protein DPMN_144933 [Dreissena polymorpha]